MASVGAVCQMALRASAFTGSGHILGQPVSLLIEGYTVCTENSTAPPLGRGCKGILSNSRLNNRNALENTTTRRYLSLHSLQKDSLSTFLHNQLTTQ